jgi:predicted transglutaminase-like cysteine proteinase
MVKMEKTKSGKTKSVSEIHREYRRTRKRDAAALCKKYNTTSVMEATYKQLLEINERVNTLLQRKNEK